MKHQESGQDITRQLAPQQQLLDLLRRKTAVHDQMVALLRAPHQQLKLNNKPLTWAGLREEYARLEEEINRIRRQVN